MSAAYRLNVVLLRGVAASGEWFRIRVPAEIADALAHDAARTIARLEGEERQELCGIVMPLLP